MWGGRSPSLGKQGPKVGRREEKRKAESQKSKGELKVCGMGRENKQEKTLKRNGKQKGWRDSNEETAEI